MVRTLIRLAALAVLALGTHAPVHGEGATPAAVVVTGQVLGPDGKPFTGAKVYVSTYTEKDQTAPEVRATAGPDGRFAFKATASEVRCNETVVAVADGYGADWTELASLDGSGALPALRLVADDVPITGRVLDLENRPIANAGVRILRVRKMPTEDLGPWVKDFQAAGSKPVFDLSRVRAVMTYERVMKPVWGILGVPHSVKADADGRCRLAGFGRERLVELLIDGPGVEHRRVTVMTRSEAPRGLPPFTYAARFEHRAAPAKPMVGTVREKGSGKPATGVEVSCGLVSGGGSLTDLATSAGASATTDDQGRYRLAGTAKAKLYVLAAAGGPYFASPRIVADTAGLEPLTVHFELERGLLLRGRLTDKAAQRPVRGILYYFPRPDNPHLKQYPEFAKFSTNMAQTEKDGSFAMAVVPGPGWICARAIDDRFVRADFDGDLSAAPVLIQYAAFHAIVAINPALKEPKSLVCDLSLDPGLAVSGTLRGPDDKPLSGAQAAGLTAAYSPLHGSYPTAKLTSAAFTAVGLSPRRPRTVVFWHEEKKLARAVPIRGDESAPLRVRLQPMAAATGVLPDAGGRAQEGVRVEARYSSRQDGTLPGELGKAIPGIPDTALPPPQATTDSHGRFRLEGLIPGLNYDLFAVGEKKPFRIAHDVSVPGGACKDLGELRADPKPSN
jgi:hypothetical protein